ncbi:unnamed protein product [Protopolystoma xenopodis]|uniref:Uncharacterized protein n=1 Tax=Protopolystoma xenopodis TaxID=117903 RepID=A0A3S5AHS5_9PLAT|nr:unnamed protein product [Protopolystoma xenopodis]
MSPSLLGKLDQPPSFSDEMTSTLNLALESSQVKTTQAKPSRRKAAFRHTSSLGCEENRQKDSPTGQRYRFYDGKGV